MLNCWVCPWVCWLLISACTLRTRYLHSSKLPQYQYQCNLASGLCQYCEKETLLTTEASAYLSSNNFQPRINSKFLQNLMPIFICIASISRFDLFDLSHCLSHIWVCHWQSWMECLLCPDLLSDDIVGSLLDWLHDVEPICWSCPHGTGLQYVGRITLAHCCTHRPSAQTRNSIW